MWVQSQSGRRLVNLALARYIGIGTDGTLPRDDPAGVGYTEYLVKATFATGHGGEGGGDTEVLARYDTRAEAEALLASLMTTLRCGGGHYTVAPVQLDTVPGDAVAAGVGAAPWTPWSEGRE